jgi:phospholipid/cholesterol/gamma-HCH transport system permease protein
MPGQNNIFHFVKETGGIIHFTGRTIRYMFKRPFEFTEFIKQATNAGLNSLPLVSITALIMGLVLTLQTRPVLADLGAEAWLPGMVFISVVVEIGPVIISLIFAGKVGSGIGAELSSMRVSEQIDAMEVSGTYPMKYLVVTRVAATTLMLPLLVVYADFLALVGSYLGISMHQGYAFGLFVKEAFNDLYFHDVFPAFIKTILFGFSVGVISCYYGYHTNRGAEGVGKATNTAVVISSVMVFIIDLLAVQITNLIL